MAQAQRHHMLVSGSPLTVRVPGPSLLEKPWIRGASTSIVAPPHVPEAPTVLDIDSPNIAGFVHRHARRAPTQTVFYVPKSVARADRCNDIPAEPAWTPCSWAFLSDFTADLTLNWQRAYRDLLGGPKTKKPVAAVLISPPEDFVGKLTVVPGTYLHVPFAHVNP
jgi:hypothetical protein